MGLLAANAKYNEEAGEGYGFLKNAYWWGGMTLMILGELCNLAAYAFTDAILVTPLGALSVVVTTVLSAIFLKERLSMVGKVSCFLCLVGSVVIVMNAPQQSAVATIEQMQDFVIKPGFLSYAGVIIIGFFVAAVLFRGFKGSANQIVSVVMGFLTICAGVVLLQLSKSAKDVPDTAVFTGNLDQIHTIAEQEQSETEPKADAIRGAAAIVRRFSATRQKREAEEFKRLHEEKQREQLAPVGEDGPEYEWDGLRRRKTMLGSQSSVGRGRSGTVRSTFTIPRTPEVHPPLGMSHFPTDDELADIDRPSSPGMMSSIAGTIRNRARSVLTPNRPDFSLDPKQHPPMPPVPLTDIAVSGHSINDGSSYRTGPHDSDYGVSNTEYAGAKGVYHARHGSHVSGVSGGSSFLAPTPPPHTARRQFSFQNIFKRGQTSSSAVEADDELPHPPRSAGHLTRFGLGSRGNSTPQVKNATEEEQAGLVKGDSRSMPALPRYDDDDDDDYDDDENDEYYPGDDKRHVLGHSGDLSSTQASKYGRGITGSPPSRAREDQVAQEAEYEAQRTRYNTSRGGSERSPSPPQPPPHRTPPHRKGGSRDAFM
ncbi:magnesium transporter NIPA1 like protein [Verticillium longisporum]|uniref:Magnesium transporter NIPA1 like protein n=1 Tax=Verticillium longisporum TaxID=100787 RepID=A0A8I2Z7Q4_VERLO|nr:magnesium transporter NIPA1 like protein [Verticillium longisporum]